MFSMTVAGAGTLGTAAAETAAKKIGSVSVCQILTGLVFWKSAIGLLADEVGDQLD